MNSFDDPIHLKPVRSTLRMQHDHPLSELFKAKRENDLARRDALQALADWTAGKLGFDLLDAELQRWISNTAAVAAAARARRDFVPSAHGSERLDD